MSEVRVFPLGLLPTEAVIVTDGNERSSLAVVRSLGARGVPVYVGADTVSSLAGVSRYCRGAFVYPSPWTHPQEYLASLLDHARRFQAGLIFPMTDIAVEILGEYQQGGGEEFTLPIPSLANYQLLSDKFYLMKWAQEAEIPIPTTLFIHGRQDVETEIDKIHRWPVVVKPGRSLVKDGAVWKKTAVAMASDPDELRQLYWDRWYLTWPSLIQEQVIGCGEGVFGLFVDGKSTAIFAHRRLREKPPSGGVSVLRESIAPPPAMTDYATRIMQSVAWQGVAMVEFKVAAATRVPYLMEVNGRFWGSLQLAIDAGIDFPWLLYRLAKIGQRQNENVPYQVGVKSRWWLGDFDHLLIRMRKADTELNFPPGSLSRWEVCKSVFCPWEHNTRSEVFRLSDPKPGFHELEDYCQSLMRAVGGVCGRYLSDWRGRCTRVIWYLGLLAGIHRRDISSRFPRSVAYVLVLCKGNICRSPFADRWLCGRLSELDIPIEVSSAGLETTPGKEAYPLATVVSRDFRVDLGDHRTTMVSKELVAKADVILVMEVAHIRQLLEKFPDAGGKTFLLGHFAEENPITDIRDPYGCSREEFIRCYKCLIAACQGFLDQLQTHAKLSD